MSEARIFFPGFSVICPEGWQDISDILSGEDRPFTIADPTNGVGVLQFSPAIFRSGTVPHPLIADLMGMLEEFARSRGLGNSLSTSTTIFADGIIGVTATFHSGDDVVVVWYVSDGKNILLSTYTSDWNSREIERSQRESIVRSIEFEF